MADTIIKNINGEDGLLIETANHSRDRGAITYVSEVSGGWFDRAATVAAIEALTALVEEADAEEAAKEAARIKRGDQLRTDISRYVALTDEDERGLLDVVNIDLGPVLANAGSGDFRIVRRAIQ